MSLRRDTRATTAQDELLPIPHWPRRIKAALGMGLIWAVAGILAGGVLARVPGFSADVPFSILFAQFGFVSGIIFNCRSVALPAGAR